MNQYSQSTREEVQKLLQQAGYYRGPIDGVVGNDTRSALIDYARAV
jgi:peptidoglycan hydrolase-like protein with peptidoglycan-binding domain